MKKAQVIKFWKELEDSTVSEPVIKKHAKKTGYGSRRTLERLNQARLGFKKGTDLSEISRLTSWSDNYVTNIRQWWLVWQGSPPLPVADFSIEEKTVQNTEGISRWSRFREIIIIVATTPPKPQSYVAWALLLWAISIMIILQAAMAIGSRPF